MRVLLFFLIFVSVNASYASATASPERRAVVYVEAGLDPTRPVAELSSRLLAGQPASPYAVELARRLRVGSAGTGFFVNEEGYLVTNAHVVLGGVRYLGLHLTRTQWDSMALTLTTIRTIWVTVGEGEEERSYAAQPVALAEELDLAILHVIRPPGDGSKFDALPVADSNHLQIGEAVRALGFNSNGLQDTSGTLLSLIRGQQVHERMNIVKRRDPVTGEEKTTVSGTSPGPIRRLHHNAPVGHGNSGGPILNSQGQVVGVAYALISDQRAEAGVTPELAGLNLAIASNVLSNFLRENGIRFTEARP